MQRHTIPLTKRAHLFLEVPFRMVRPLLVDIPHQCTEIRRTDREQTISTLPCKFRHALLLHPNRRGSFQLGYSLRRGSGRSQSQPKMHMIRHAAGPKALAVEFAGSAGKISVQCRRKLVTNEWRSVLGAENDMHQIETERLWHRVYRASSPRSNVRHDLLGLRPRLLCSRAVGPLDPLLHNRLPEHHHASGAHRRTHHVEVTA